MTEQAIPGYWSYSNGNGERFPSYVACIKTFKNSVRRLIVRTVVPQFERLISSGLAGVAPRKARGSEPMSEWDRFRSVSRSVARIEELCTQLGADRLLTLTVRDNVQDQEVFAAMLKRFHRGLRLAGVGFQYVMVMEQQKRGAWHAHYAISGFQDVRVLRRLWVAICKGFGGGNVDVTRPMKRAGIARYLGKYIGKNVDVVGLNKKRYWCSPGIGSPVKLRFYMWAESVEEMLDEVKSICGALELEVSDFYLSKRWGYCCVEGLPKCPF